MSKYQAIQESAYEANMQLPKLGLVLFTFGNVSAADRSLAVFAIKPSGVAYEELTPDKMVIVDFDGKTVEGKLRPSSDTLTHAVLYKHWEKIGGIVHTTRICRITIVLAKNIIVGRFLLWFCEKNVYLCLIEL